MSSSEIRQHASQAIYDESLLRTGGTALGSLGDFVHASSGDDGKRVSVHTVGSHGFMSILHANQ